MPRFQPIPFPLGISVLAIGLFPTLSLAQTPDPIENPVVEGCLVGTPDGTFQGDRPVTRYEFAAGLSACFNLLDRQIHSNNLETYATEAEVQDAIQQQQELNQELEILDERVDELLGEPSPSQSTPQER